MRIRVTGECDAAKVLRKKLPQAGFVVTESLPDYSVAIEIHEEDSIIIDGIPCPFETQTAFHVSKLTSADIRLRRRTGDVFRDDQIKVTLRAVPEEENAVELGIIRALLEISGQKTRKKFWQVWRTKAATAFLLALWASLATAQGTLPTGQVPTKVNLTSISGTTVTAGAGLPVNCISGCSGGTLSNNGAAPGATNSGVLPAVANAAAPTYIEGRQVLLSTDLGGSLRIICIAGCGAPAAFNDNSAFTAGTSSIANVGAVFNDGLGAVTAGNAAAPRITAQRGLHVNLRNTAGTEVGTAGAALRIDPTGATVQPVSAASLPLPSGAATSGKQPALGTAGAASADVISIQGIAGMTAVTISGTVTTSPPANATENITQFGGTNLSTGTGVGGAGIPRVTVSSDSFPATQAISGTVTANQGTANATPWNENVAQINGVTPLMGNGVTGTGSPRVTIASDNTAFSVNASGTKTNNNAAPGATNIGALNAVANAAAPAWTEGNQVAESVDLNGGLRVVTRPPVVLGCYSAEQGTGVYAGIAAGGAVWSARWGDATRFAVVNQVTVSVIASAPGTAGRVDRALFFARIFTASDSGGTVYTLTGNNNKLRTANGTSLFTDMRIATNAALGAGTRTLDTQALGVAATWMDNSTAPNVAAVGTTFPQTRIIDRVDLFNAKDNMGYPIVLAQNEGLVVTMPSVEPTSVSLSTFVGIKWCEVTTF